MTTPGSHDDAYASSYHRIFFARHAQGVPLRKCPSNDGHNVDAIDGLIVPAVVLLGSISETEEEARAAAQESVRVTRFSPVVEEYVVDLSLLLRAVFAGKPLSDAAQEAATRRFGRPLSLSEPDPVVACYIEPNFQSLLLLAAKYSGFRECVLANTNAGGENVHRGLVLGALLGAQVGASNIPEDLKDGLHDSETIRLEIDNFVKTLVSVESDGRSSCPTGDEGRLA